MQNASQSDPGFHEQQGAVPILKRARGAAPQIVAGGVATGAILCMLTVAWARYSDRQATQQQDLIAQQVQTNVGEFAIAPLLQCKPKATFHSVLNTNVDCITRAIDPAQTVTGDQIAGEVTRHLGTWLDRSTRLQALRLDDRQIANYIAKYGFSLVRLVGNVVFQGRPR